MDNKRSSERLPMFKVIRYNVEGREYADLSTNISDRGIFIKSFAPPPIDTAVVLTVTLPERWGNQPMKIVGRVAWTNEDPDPHKRGMGIEFMSVFANSLPIIEYFVSEVYPKSRFAPDRVESRQDADSQGTTYHYRLEGEESEG
ncbi:MAG: PilZ domain-containing protein [Deltaproteobacteria bacterium]|nr:PilZ domain-containing protein [Deltaproteobacteria bacterium]